MRSNDDWYEEQEDWTDDEASETVPCPECGADVYEDAVSCPACGHYITADTNPWSGRSLWWVVLGVLGVIATIVALASLP